jgi:hypothetical protein
MRFGLLLLLLLLIIDERVKILRCVLVVGPVLYYSVSVYCVWMKGREELLKVKGQGGEGEA